MTMVTLENGEQSKQLQLLLQEIEQQLQWGSGVNWRHQDFQTLSEKILDKTGEQLSTNTLKRIWGKLPYNSLPNSHTLNTLAQFANYENWLVFQSNHYPITVSKEVEKEPPNIPLKPTFATPILKISAVLILLLGLALVAISLIPKPSSKPLSPSVLESIQFSSHPVTSGVPNTVVFKYDVSQVPSDSIQIQQNWDERRRFFISKDQSEVTSTYYYPGHWKAKLVVDNQVIKEQDIYIKSEGWLATINRKPIPRYLKKEELATDGFLGVSSSIHREIMENTAQPEVLAYHFIEEFPNLESSNFSLELLFKNTYTKGDAICQYSRIAIDCTEGVFLIPFTIPGCVGDISMRFNDIRQRGHNHDFSAFGCDFEAWQHFKLAVKNKKAKIFLNHQLIHTVTYQEDAGKVAGMNIWFAGAGMIDDVKLSDGTGTIVYQEDFDNQ